jgi:uncharacterized protein YbaR (Trm112 family)
MPASFICPVCGGGGTSVSRDGTAFYCRDCNRIHRISEPLAVQITEPGEKKIVIPNCR